VSWATVAVAEGVLQTTIDVQYRGTRNWSKSASVFKLLGKPNPDPLQKDLKASLAEIDRRFELREAIEEICFANGLTVFAITGGRFADRMCWEALPLIFKHENRRALFAPVRLSDSQTPWRPERVGEKLRITSIVGHPGRSTAFDFQTVDELVRRMFSMLSPAQRELVDQPDKPHIIDIADADRRAWTSEVAANSPHLMLYFGHGESTPQPRIQTSRDGWTPLHEVVTDLAVTGISFPPFWCFVACSLGEGQVDAARQVIGGPAAFGLLARNGAVSMVAMRSPIRVSIAKVFLTDYLARFVTGASPEISAASARLTALASDRSGPGAPQDWAAAAVWSVAQPLQALSWGINDSEARQADVALRLLRITALAPALGSQELNEADVAKARNWLRERRVRVSTPVDGRQPDASAFMSLLEAARRAHGAFPILIATSQMGQSYSSRLKQWASEIQRSLLPSIDEPLFAAAISRLASGAEDGLKALLAFPRSFLVLVTPPNVGDPIWATLRAAPQDTTVVLCQPEGVSGLPSDTWFEDTIFEDDVDAGAIIVDALAKVPRSLAVLAAAQRPIRPTDLARISGELVPAADGVVITQEGGSGLAIPGRLRDRIAVDLGANAMLVAHRELAFYLADRGQASLPWGDFAILHHLARAELWSELASAVNRMVEASSPTDIDWLELGRVLNALPPASVPFFYPEVFLDLARAFIDLQDLESAAVWLERSKPERNLDKARRAGLFSEVWKGRGEPGAKDEMWREAEVAIQLCRAELDQNPQSDLALRELRNHQLQLARLKLYFRSDATEARTALEQLIVDLETGTDLVSAHALCAAKRNLAECLFEFAPFKGDRDSATIAARHLADAAVISHQEHLGELRCDILYSQAKLSESQGDFQSAAAFLANCVREAQVVGYEVAYRIADARGYWHRVLREGADWDYATYRSYQQPLDFLDWHLWAVRYAAHCRLMGAKRLVRANPKEAHSALQRTVQVFKARNVLSGRSDEATLIRAAAGLALLGDAEVWSEVVFNSQTRDLCGRTPEDIWSEVA
jgi:hypothetical protein